MTDPTMFAPDATPAPSDTCSRADILDECIKAAEAWDSQPGRNLVLLFDGTGNILCNQRDTNVVRLLRSLVKDAPASAHATGQLVYYDPGVGTANSVPANSWHAKIRHYADRIAGMALGSGAFQNIAEAYEFLVRHYHDGDRIYLFGFSRGAFTARAVGGMINAYGLVHASGVSMIPLMVTNYFAKEVRNGAGRVKHEFSSDIRTHFALGRTPLVHFTGVWDTVETIGSGFLGGVHISNHADIEAKRFVHVRHAVALHELRCKYAPRHYVDPGYLPHERTHRSLEERCFAGAHSDVGGSYPRDGLSVISLRWMVQETQAKGLQVQHRQFVALDPDCTMHDEAYEIPFWAWTGLSTRERPAHVVADPSIVQQDHRHHAHSVPRNDPWLTSLGWVLALAVLVFGWGAMVASSNACPIPSGIADWFASNLRLLTPQPDGTEVACSASNNYLALKWDWAFLLIYAAWLPYPVAWALRRLAVPALRAGRKLALLPRNAQWWMVALVVSDGIENAALYWLAGGTFAALDTLAPFLPAVQVLASVVKLLSLSALLWIVVMGALSSQKLLPVRQSRGLDKQRPVTLEQERVHETAAGS